MRLTPAMDCIDLMDEAASKIRMEIDSLPAELDEISRKIMQLEIEKQALGNAGPLADYAGDLLLGDLLLQKAVLPAGVHPLPLLLQLLLQPGQGIVFQPGHFLQVVAAPSSGASRSGLRSTTACGSPMGR